MQFCTLILRVISVSALLLAASRPAQAATLVSDFATDFGGWSQQWHKASPSMSGTPGLVTHATDRGYLDGASLKFDMGDGTLWIERPLPRSPTLPTRIDLS